MSEAIIGLVSAVAVVLLKGVFDYIMDRRKRKDKLEDDKTEEKDEILAAIKGVREEVHEVMAEVEKTKEEVRLVKDAQEEETVVQCRVRILRFADESRHGQRHSKDHFDQTLEDITKYESYCRTHPNFKNDITNASVEIIRESFKERMKKNDFL